MRAITFVFNESSIKDSIDLVENRMNAIVKENKTNIQFLLLSPDWARLKCYHFNGILISVHYNRWLKKYKLKSPKKDSRYQMHMSPLATMGAAYKWGIYMHKRYADHLLRQVDFLTHGVAQEMWYCQYLAKDALRGY